MSATRVFATLATMLGAGCVAEPAGLAPPTSSVSSRALAERGSATRTLDDEFERVAQEYPEFAGAFLQNGELVIRVASSSISSARVEEIERALAPVLVAMPYRGVQMAMAEYSWSELQAGLRSTRPFLDEHVILLDIDEVANRVVIGVERQADVAPLRAKLEREAGSWLRIDVVGTVTLENDLDGLFRPIAGAIRIRPFTPNGTQDCDAGVDCGCSLAASVTSEPTTSPTWSSADHFALTASHCSPFTRGVADSASGQWWGQPNFWNPLGTEVADPPYLQYPGHPDIKCPSGVHCRYADAALLRVYPGTNPWPEHRVALTVSGTLSFSHFTDLQGVLMFPVAGLGIVKSGAATGSTWGTIQQTCVYVQEPLSGARGLPRPIGHTCLFLASYWSALGDSGGAVVLSGLGLSTYLVGLHTLRFSSGLRAFSGAQVALQELRPFLPSHVD